MLTRSSAASATASPIPAHSPSSAAVRRRRSFGGVDFGGYYDFAHFSKADVGVDVRDAIEHGNNASLNSFWWALRLAAKPMAFAGLKPYVQFSVGAGRTRPPKSNAHIERLQYGIYVGVDKAARQARGLAHH